METEQEEKAGSRATVAERSRGSGGLSGHKPCSSLRHPIPTVSWVTCRVEPRMSHWCLNLKRSSACTNVSLLNLTAMEPDSSGTDSTTEDSGPLALPGPPASPTTPWAPEDPDITELLVSSSRGEGRGLLNGGRELIWF